MISEVIKLVLFALFIDLYVSHLTTTNITGTIYRSIILLKPWSLSIVLMDPCRTSSFKISWQKFWDKIYINLTVNSRSEVGRNAVRWFWLWHWMFQLKHVSSNDVDRAPVGTNVDVTNNDSCMYWDIPCYEMLFRRCSRHRAKKFASALNYQVRIYKSESS